MTLRAVRSIAACAAIALFCSPFGSPRAAPNSPPTGVRLVVLSPAEVSQLGQVWQPMGRAAFEKLVREARPATGAPAGVGVPRATYEATFAGDSLTAGRLSLRVHRQDRTSEWLDLGDVNLAISKLRQGNRDVVWGTTATGRVMARITDDTLPLTGSWTLPGERIGRRYRFEVRLIPATTSQLTLRLPRGYRLEASAGIVSGPRPSGARNGWEWRVSVSSADATLLTVVPPEPGAAEKPVVLLESETDYVVRDNGLRIKFRATPEVLQRGVDGLTFHLPADVSVYAVDYGGSNMPLEFTVRKAAGGKRLHVYFPHPLLGRGRAVIVQAVADVRLNRPWELPRIEAADALFLHGHVHLGVERPLVIESLTSAGMRQTTGVSPSQNGETLSFDCQRPDAPLRLTVARLPTLTDCRAVTHLDVVGDQWRATSEITWAPRQGALYALRCRAAAGWQLGLVQLVSSLTPETERTISWTEQRVEQGRRLLSFDLPRGLPAGESVTLRIAARRPAQSRRRRQLQWPVISPQGVERFESVVVIPPGLLPHDPAVSTPGFHRIYADELPEFVRKSKVWTAAVASGTGTPAVFRSRLLSFRRPVFLGKPEPAFDATSWTFVKSSADAVREQFHVTVTPQQEPVDAVLIYLSRKRPDLNWTLRSPSGQTAAVRAARLPAARLAAWKLPDSGELWEIKPSQPAAKPFEVVAEQSRIAGPDRPIALPILPQARRFVGHVAVYASEVGGTFRPEVQEHLFPIDAPKLRPSKKDVRPPASVWKTARFWRYRNAQAALTLRQTGPRTASTPQTPVNVEVWSVFSASAGGLDAHRIVFRMPPEPRVSEFAFRMNEAANVNTVLLNGRPVDTVQTKDEQTVQSLPAGNANTVEVRYTVPSANVGWSTRRDVAVPRCARPVGNLRWHFALPPHVALSAGPPGVTVGPVAPRPNWRTRLFGPLARSPESPLFNPLSERSWRRLVGSDPLQPVGGRPAESDHDEHERGTDNSWAPAGWSVHTAVGVDVPSIIELQLSNRDRTRLWAWIGLLFCLIAGWVVRRAEFARRRRIGAVWLSACLAAALFVPGQYAEFAGACLAGSLIATVLSRKLVRRETARDESLSVVPPGSTISYPRVITTALILIGLAMIAADALAAIAQPVPLTTGSESPPAPLDSNSVVIPAASNGKQPDSGPIVYVHRELLASLQRQAALARPPKYVLRHAAYRIGVEVPHSADVTATYDAVVVEPEKTVSVLLPIHDAALCGPDACRVNGRVQPVRRDPAGRGFLVDIPAIHKPDNLHDILKSPEELLAATIGLPGSLGMTPLLRPPARPGPRRCRIELCLQARVETVQKDQRLQIRVPRIASGGLELELPFDSRPVAIQGLTAAKSDRGWFSQSLSGRLAPADVLELDWGDAASLALRQSKLTADVRGLADIGVAKIRVRYVVRYSVASGSVNSVVWSVPRNWVLRTVTLPEAPTRRPAPLASDSTERRPVTLPDAPARHPVFRKLRSKGKTDSQIRIDLPAARSKPFSLEAEFLVPLAGPKRKAKRGKAKAGARKTPVSRRFRLRMPRLHEATPGLSTVARVEETSNQFAVSSNAEVGLVITPANQAAVRALDRERFAEFREDFPGSRLPDEVYELQQPTALNGSVTPYVPRRTVRQVQTGRLDGEQLRWTLAADVTVDTAPAYRHDLLVDPRLTVDSVRVKEDEAPRLVRWSRVGNRVHLFLSDKTAATQKVELEARMRVRPGAAFLLPNVRFADATIESSQIALFRTPELGVAVVDRGDWERVTPRAADVTNADEISVAAFRLFPIRPANPRAPRVRAVARRATLNVQRLAALKLTKQRGRTVECTLEFRDTLPRSEYSVFLPREIAAVAVFNAGEWKSVRERQTDAGVLRRLRPITEDGKLPPLTIRYPLPAPGTRRWELPLPAPRFAELKQDVLAIAPNGDALSVSSAADRVRPSAVAAWMSKRVRGAVVYRNRGRSWQLATGTEASKDTGLTVPFLETSVWLGGEHNDYGCTQAFVATDGQSSVEFHWPDGVSLRSVRVNGRPVTTTPNDGRLNVPLDSRSLEFVRIDWERENASGRRGIGHDAVDFPSPVSATQTPSLVTIVPSPRQSVFRLSEFDKLGAVAYAVRRIERLLEAAQRQVPTSSENPADVHAAAAVNAADRSHRSLTQFLQSPAAKGQVLDADLRQRLGRIDTALKRARERLAAVGSTKERLPADATVKLRTDRTSISADDLRPVSFTMFDANTEGPLYGELQMADDRAEVGFWHIDNSLLAALLAAGVLLLALPFARPLFRAEIGERLAHWEPVSWIVLGTVWWLFLVPSFVGLVLFSVAVAKFVRRRLRRRAAGNVIRLHELSKSRERRAGSS